MRATLLLLLMTSVASASVIEFQAHTNTSPYRFGPVQTGPDITGFFDTSGGISFVDSNMTAWEIPNLEFKGCSSWACFWNTPGSSTWSASDYRGNNPYMTAFATFARDESGNKLDELGNLTAFALRPGDEVYTRFQATISAPIPGREPSVLQPVPEPVIGWSIFAAGFMAILAYSRRLR